MNHRVVAEIDLSAVRHNVGEILALVGPAVGVMAIVKADGYGHGAVEVARAALDAGASWLGIATVSEGLALREALPEARIGHLPPFTVDGCTEIVRHRLTPFVSGVDGLATLQGAAERLGVRADFHLEVDTGMGRSGAKPAEAIDIANEAATGEHISMTGIATHFAAAETDPEYTAQQIEIFDRVRTDIGSKHGATIAHAANSGATLLYPAARYDLVRPGLLIYGILPHLPEAGVTLSLRPVLTLKTQIALIRTLAPGESISYNRTHVLRRPSRIATLPVGYGDGYPRAMSNVGHVLVGGKRAPIVGRVCMDVTMVDVTDVPGAEAGSEVILIGRQGDREIRVEEVARHAQTTEHVITTRLTSRVPRRYVEQQQWQ